MIGMLRKRSPDEGSQRVRVLGQFARLAVAQPILPRSTSAVGGRCYLFLSSGTYPT